MKQILTLLFFVFALFAKAEMVDTYQFKNQTDRMRAVELAKSLRCPQCQNQNLVESNSPIAYDLRIEVYKLVDEGKTDQQIIDTMTARFGDFVNYKPPFQWNTALLWLLPVGLLILAFGLIYQSRRKNAFPPRLQGETVHRAEMENIASLGATSSAAHKQNKPSLSWKKNSQKVSLILFLLVLAMPIAYYFSLDRFERVQQGEQTMQEWHNRQIEMTDAHKTEDIIGKIQDKLRANPNDEEAWTQLGEAYVQNNEFEYALIAYNNAEKLAGDKPSILGLKATALYYLADKRMTPEIQNLITRALQQDKKEIASLSLLSAVALEAGRYDEAKDYLQQLLDSANNAVDRRMVIQRMKMLEFLQRGETP